MRMVLLLLGLLAVGGLVYQQLGAGSQLAGASDNVAPAAAKTAEVEQALNEALDKQAQRLQQHGDY